MQKRAARKPKPARTSARLFYRGPGWCSATKRLALYLRDDFTCAYCGKDLRNARPQEMGLDHLRCHALGGNNEPSNLVTACRSCNSARGTRAWTRYATGGAVERIRTLRSTPLNWALARSIVRTSARTEWADSCDLSA
jgi:5-methylcytosine-specific restriction endonuclease McrA